MSKIGWVRTLLVGVCVLTVGFYAAMGLSAVSELGNTTAAGAYYNRLVDGFRAGQLNLKMEVPKGLTQLADPYDPATNGAYRGELFGPHRLHDLSYYHGKLYLYFGVTPALVLFLPYAVLTSHYLDHQQAVAIFAALGFLLSVGLLYAMWRRYFQEVNAGVVAAGALALGFLTSMPLLLARPDVWEVPVSLAYAMVMLTLVALWKSLHDAPHRGRWLALASLAYGLALGARPSVLFGAVVLLTPVAHAWQTSTAPRSERWRPTLRLLAAAIAPIFFVGLGLLLYNYLRFGKPQEFGESYQLAGDRQNDMQHFGLIHLWFNFRVYFLAPVAWGKIFPYVQDITPPPLPPGHGGLEYPFGVMANSPLAWLALAIPLVWRKRPDDQRAVLRWFLAAAALLFITSAVTMGLFYGTCSRYELEFIPALIVLTVAGLLGVERALADHRGWRNAVRCVWALLLVFSLAFNVLYGFKRRAEMDFVHAQVLLSHDRIDAAIAPLKAGLRLKPDLPNGQAMLALALCHSGRQQEAWTQLEKAFRSDPEMAPTYGRWYSGELLRSGHGDEALAQFQTALQRAPTSALLHNGLGEILVQLGRTPEALSHFQEAISLNPNFAPAYDNLGLAAARAGQWPEAARRFEQAVRVAPQFPDAHFHLGTVLLKMGQVDEARAQLEQVLQIAPNFKPARDLLLRLQSVSP